MFDKLLDILKAGYEHIVPWYIVPEMEKACVLRLGRYHRVLEVGAHWKIPFVDRVYSQHVKTCTVHLPSQSLTTKDNKSIVIKVLVRYIITDVKQYTIEVWDAHDIITDTIQGVVGNIVSNHTWEEVQGGIEDVIMTQAHDIVSNWGVEIQKITLSDLAPIRTIRLLR